MAKRGETREIIIDAATKVFFKYGFERTSVKMILEEAGVVTGSFYHFFPSKEALFEAVIEKYLQGYSQRIGDILCDESLSLDQIVDKVLEELNHTSKEYYLKLQGDKLHWTVEASLHVITIETLVEPLARALGRLIKSGEIESRLRVNDTTLARILIKGMEAVIHDGSNTGMECFDHEGLRERLMEFCERIIVIR
ncbi:MAG: TetR/AcrR family transcriptional regulator [Lachnospiraceae bacterium]|nr:TetR/AcrR family transcriptional regulator [Lachnospiraceae bacterium]